eukprot:jgi/Bigna1/83259/fgenesh1_pg.105_\
MALILRHAWSMSQVSDNKAKTLILEILKRLQRSQKDPEHESRMKSKLETLGDEISSHVDLNVTIEVTGKKSVFKDLLLLNRRKSTDGRRIYVLKASGGCVAPIVYVRHGQLSYSALGTITEHHWRLKPHINAFLWSPKAWDKWWFLKSDISLGLSPGDRVIAELPNEYCKEDYVISPQRHGECKVLDSRTRKRESRAVLDFVEDGLEVRAVIKQLVYGENHSKEVGIVTVVPFNGG